MSSLPLHITVPWDVNKTSPNKRGHWRMRAIWTKRGRDVARAAWIAAGRPMVAEPVQVSMIVRRARVVDQDNAIGGSKCLRDSLFNDGITPQDSQEWVRLGGVTVESHKRYKGCEECVFIVESLAS